MLPFVCTGVNYEKLISWNVNGLRACVTKGFENFLKMLTQIFSVFRKQSSKRDRLTSCLKDIISIGAMPTKRLFGNGYVHKRRAFECMLRDRH